MNSHYHRCPSNQFSSAKSSQTRLLLREGPIVVAPRLQRTLFMSAKEKKRESKTKRIYVLGLG